MEQIRHQNFSWANDATATASGSRSSSAYNGTFSNAFPLNLINKNKIRVDFDYTSADENEEKTNSTNNNVFKESESREIPIQRVEEPEESDDEDMPDLIDPESDTETPIKNIKEACAVANKLLDKIINLNDEEMKTQEVKQYPKDVMFPNIQILAMPFPQIANPIPNPFANRFAAAMSIPIFDIARSNTAQVVAQMQAAARPQTQTPAQETAAAMAAQVEAARPKSYVLGYVSSDAAVSTPEDDLFIANYMRQHSASEIQRALAACKKEYEASVAKVKEAEKDSEEEESEDQEPESPEAEESESQEQDSEEDEIKIQPVPDVNNVSENPIKYTPDGHVETDISISSEKFNEIFAGVPLVKLTNEACCHNGMVFHEGENEDFNPFRYDHSCGPDGIYFCRLDDMFNWLDYSSAPMYYMWDVEVPAGARAVMYSNKLKANRLVLSNQRKISDYVTSKLMGMIINDESIDEVFNFIGRLSSVTRPDAQSMEDIYLAMLGRNFELFSRIPEDQRTYNLSMFLAINDPNGYEKIKDECVSHEILMECLKKNPDVYYSIPEEQRSQEMSDYLFTLNAENYSAINDEHKTVQMTEKYLEETQDTDPTEVVPQRFTNEPSVMPILIAKNGERLEDVDYRLKDYDLCRTAVKNSGKALSSVPLALVDQAMCDDAVVDSSDAYEFVPLRFRTVELKESMVNAHPESVSLLSTEEITHNMIMCVVSNAVYLLGDDVFDFESKHITQLFVNYLKEYIDTCPTLYNFIPESLFTDAMALYMITKNAEAFDTFSDRSTKFIVDCVKIGVHFAHIPSHEVTQDMLKELVTERCSVIHELPTRFLSDELYIICMRVHGMTLSEVPEGFRTSRLAKIALELYPAEAEIQIDQIEQVEQTGSTYVVEVPTVEAVISTPVVVTAPASPAVGSIGFDSDEITEDDISTDAHVEHSLPSVDSVMEEVD